MLSIERQEQILDRLDKDGIVKVAELSKRLDVTEKTVRMDLETLENQGHLKRIHGGAVISEEAGHILPIRKRQSKNRDKKIAIASEALRRITPGETIILDGGSTTYALAEMLGDVEVTVITNDVRVAHVLLDKEKIRLMMLGGMQIDHTAALMGTQAAETLQKLRVNRLFLGTTGVDVQGGLTVFNSLHADWKKEIMQRAEKITLLADSTKFGKIALLQFASVEQLDDIVTDEEVDSNAIRSFREKTNTFLTTARSMSEG